MSYRDTHHVEQIYQCEGCGDYWLESVVGVRPLSRDLYCRSCNGKVRLIQEEEEEREGEASPISR